MATDDLERRLDAMIQSGEIDQQLVQEILTLGPGDPAVDRITAKLVEMGADAGPSPVMQIEDYYRPGEQPFTLQWPLAETTAAGLPMAFELLDRKTQFFVLFQEWTNRNLDGHVALESGDLAGARAIFEEGIARAEQIAVAELAARSYEGLISVAETAGDPGAARTALDAAIAIRESGRM